MRICLVSPRSAGLGSAGRASELLATLLGACHEVVVLDAEAEPSPDLAGVGFASPVHRRAAAVLEQLRAAYGERGPDYLEVADAGAAGLVTLQARRTGDPLLAETLIGVRISPSQELIALHDRELSEPEAWRLAELEREQLRLADRLIWPGGDTLELYRRYYADMELPAGVRIRVPVEEVEAPAARTAREPGGPLRILFAGELRRDLGVLDLVEACLRQPDDDWELTLLGDDTETATMGQSVRLTIESMLGEDPRVRIEDAVDGAELRRRLPDHDLLAVPSQVDAWSEVAIEAMRAGVPVLATPVGGLVEIVVDGISGWLCEDRGPEAIGRALARLLADREEVERVRGSGAVARRFAELADPGPILAAYEVLAAPAAGRVGATPLGTPLITGIVPYFEASDHVAEAVGSLLGQTHAEIEVLIVNDGSFAAADSVLSELEADPRVSVVTQPNRGEATARNLGALLARGEYLVMLDADNMLEPEFVERALAAFRRDPELAYVTSWLRMIDAAGIEHPHGYGYAPLGNAVVADDTENWDGDTIAMLPRRLFSELGFGYGPEGSMHSDWELYRWLRRESRFGAVIPERLARYRVLPGSLLRAHNWELHERGWVESRDRNRQRWMRWIAGG
jgi:glycosyltransferase involved in cell wall biosynthesis